MSKRYLRKDAGSSPEKEKIKTSSLSLTIETIYPDFQEWPDSWKGDDKDVPYGEGLIETFRPFVQSLIDHGWIPSVWRAAPIAAI